MVDYEAVYRVLLDGIAEALQDMERQEYGYARLTLMRAQQSAEDIFLETGDNPVVRLLKREQVPALP